MDSHRASQVGPAVIGSPQFTDLLLGSYQRAVREDMLPAGAAPEGDLTEWLYAQAGFGLLAHDASADPRFTYANRTAQRWFEYPVDQFVGMPSRLSAGVPDRDERQQLMDTVREHGYVGDYRGLRIARSGRQFWIEQTTIWNLVDGTGALRGQAALIRRCVDA
jgi:PAS domain-containing protein